MSDSEAVVEKRRGRPTKDKSEVIFCYNFMFNFNIIILFIQIVCRMLRNLKKEHEKPRRKTKML